MRGIYTTIYTYDVIIYYMEIRFKAKYEFCQNNMTKNSCVTAQGFYV